MQFWDTIKSWLLPWREPHRISSSLEDFVLACQSARDIVNIEFSEEYAEGLLKKGKALIPARVVHLHSWARCGRNVIPLIDYIADFSVRIPPTLDDWKKLAQLEQDALSKALAYTSYFKAEGITAFIVGRRPQQISYRLAVYELGDVQDPGAYLMPHKSSHCTIAGGLRAP